MNRWTRLSLSLLLLATTVGFTPPPQAAAPDNRLGAVEAWMAPDRAAELGVGWDRLIIPWYVRQPDNGEQWNVPGEETERVNTARLAGREVVALVMGTPGWASDNPVRGGVPRGLYLPVDDPGNVWASFIRRIAGEYAGRINHWIIWNEPDILPEDPGAQFEGSVADYYQLLRVAYIAARQANPQAVIHLGGVTHWHDVVYNRAPFLQRLLEVARQDPSAKANHYYFDVVTLHIYFRVESLPYIYNTYRDLLRRYGLRQPIWINETNAAPMDDPQYPWPDPLIRLTMDQQASYIVQAFALGLGLCAERIAVYKLIDGDEPRPNSDTYGLYRHDNSPRPAATAYKLVTSYLSGMTRSVLATNLRWYIVRIERGGRGVTRVAWARTAEAVTVRIRSTPGAVSVKLYDQLGQEYPVQRDPKGNYLIALPGAVCTLDPGGCTAGGSPRILVETFRQ